MCTKLSWRSQLCCESTPISLFVLPRKIGSLLGMAGQLGASLPLAVAGKQQPMQACGQSVAISVGPFR